MMSRSLSTWPQRALAMLRGQDLAREAGPVLSDLEDPTEKMGETSLRQGGGRFTAAPTGSWGGYITTFQAVETVTSQLFPSTC